MPTSRATRRSEKRADSRASPSRSSGTGSVGTIEPEVTGPPCAPGRGALRRSLLPGVVRNPLPNPTLDRSLPLAVRISQQLRDAATQHDAVVRGNPSGQRLDQTHDFRGLRRRGLGITSTRQPALGSQPSAGARAGTLQPAPAMWLSPPHWGTAQTSRRRCTTGTALLQARAVQATSLAALPRRTR